MKTIIAGSRSIEFETTIEYLSELKLLGVEITEVVSGTARGVDSHGEWWANRWGIPIKQFPANWDEYGKRAGYLRNQEMADYADQLICIWDYQSKGTKHMIDIAKKKGIPIFLMETDVKVQLSLF